MAGSPVDAARTATHARGRVRLSAVIMTHPDRVQCAQRLRDRHPELGMEIIMDPEPGGGVCALRTARLAWDAVPADATHHLVVQDDTVLCPSFVDHLERAITARPDQALALYTEWGSETSYAVRLAALLGSVWAEVVDGYVPTQALVLPADVARDFGRFTGYSGPHDDFAMHQFLASLGMAAAVTVPNLADDAQFSSIVRHEYLGSRASVCFSTTELDQTDWSTRTATPAAVPAFMWVAGHPYWRVRAEEPEGPRWRRESPRQAMPRYGGSLAVARSLGRAMVEQRPVLTRAVGTKLLFGLWLTAYGLGLAAVSLLGPNRSEVDNLLDRAVVRRALATMPRGAFRFLADDDQVAIHGDELFRFVELGVRQGYEAV